MLVVVMFVFFQPFACLSQVFRCRDLWYRLSSRKDNIDEIEEIAQDSPFTFVVLETDCLQAVIPGLFGVSLEEQIYLREVVLECCRVGVVLHPFKCQVEALINPTEAAQHPARVVVGHYEVRVQPCNKPVIRVEGLRPHRVGAIVFLSLIHISEPTRLGMISYAVFCLKKKKKKKNKK